MALIYTDTDLVEQGYLSGAVMDFQEEESENSFTLEMGLDDFPKLSDGCYVFDENNPQFGGRVQKVRIQTAQNSLTWSGLTFAGVLSTKIIEPPSGQAYREIYGTLSEKVNTILELVGLDGVFYTNASGSAESNWKIDRYTDVLSAFRKLASKSNLAMDVSFDKTHNVQKLLISFRTAKTVVAGEEYDSDLFSFDIEKDMMPVNHLICLGGGQLEERQVYHLYTNDSGTISETRPASLTKENEVFAVYDYSNVESYEELQKEGLKHFQEILDNGTKLEITPPEEAVFRLGDKIAGLEQISGIYVEKEVKKIIYKAQDDLQPTITYETSNTKRG